jgi:peptidoglycan/LPS O-acetylase OafA/YrhL
MQRNNRAQEIDMFPLSLALFLSVVMVATFSFVAVAVWSDSRRKEREAYYKSETLKKLAEAQGTGANSAVELVKEEERIALRRRLEGQKLGGLITIAVGIGLMVFLKAVDHDHPTYLVGLIPLLVGAALLAYSYVLGPEK